MTVAELIEILKGMPQDAPVTVELDAPHVGWNDWEVGPRRVCLVEDEPYGALTKNGADFEVRNGPHVRLG